MLKKSKLNKNSNYKIKFNSKMATNQNLPDAEFARLA